MKKRLSAFMLAFIMLLSALSGALAETAEFENTADMQAAEAVDEMIAAIAEVTLETQESVMEAARAYAALSDTQKRLVRNHDDLMDDIEAYMDLPSGNVQAAEAAEANALSSLVFRRSTSPESEAYALQPKFDPEVRNYTLVIEDTVNPVNAIALWAALPEGVEGEIIAEYTSLINDKPVRKTIASGAEVGATLMGCVKVKDLRANTLSITVNSVQTYSVRLVKQPTISNLQITAADGESIALTPTPEPSVLEYHAFVPADEEIEVKVETTAADALIRLNGGEATSITPVWTEGDFDLQITLSAAQAQDGEYLVHLHQKPESLYIKTLPDKTSYAVGESFEIAGLELQAVYADGIRRDVPAEAISFEPTEPLTKDVAAVTLKYAGLEIELPIRVGGGLLGSGTQADPWRIETAADFETVRQLVESGMRFEGEYLLMTRDIALPEHWTPIGSSMETAFSGNLNGGDCTLTVPEGGLPLLGCVQGAKVSHLKIYGKKIAGYGLVNDLQGVGYAGEAVSIDHVTLKSGSSTLKAGLIGTKVNAAVNQYAGCSKDFYVNISNCTVESGVVIGYNKDQSMIGSFAGRVNGTISNCVSAASVYGVDYVGGILGSRDNALGTCKVSGCSFTGEVKASGEQAGGIVGGGYSDSSAPNGLRISIDGCSASGNVSGKDKVGGILGGDIRVAQAWDVYTITNNSFTGKLSASGSAVGGVIGYYRSLNRMDDIRGNYYASDCGAKSGFGYVMYVDTSCKTHETRSGALYFNTETSVSDCPEVTGCAWKKAHNRTDDPLGADAAKLTRTDGTQVVEVTGISLDQTELKLKTGGTAKLTASVAPENATDKTVLWSSSDESVASVSGGDVTAKGFGTATITASAGGFTAECALEVTSEPAEKITVYITVSNRGVLAQAKDGSAMFDREVEVSDLNSDGVLTYDEALSAAHALYCPNGYASENSGWGVSVYKLWGVESMNFSFYLNDSALENHVGNTETSALHAGDLLTASVNQDEKYYADHYVKFSKRSCAATAGRKFTLSMGGTLGSDKITIGYWKNGGFVALDGATVDKSGNVSLVFTQAGSYLLTAKGSVRDTVQDWSAGGASVEADCPIIAAGCWVKVDEASVAPEAKAERLVITGDFKKAYAVGDRLDLKGMILSVRYSDATVREISADDAQITGFDTTTRGEKTVTLSYEGVSASFEITVSKAAGTIDVTLSVLGDSRHGSGKVHTLSGGGLTTWVKASLLNVKSGSTVWDALKQCLDEKGMSYKNATGNYVSSVNGLSEFDNGKNSGWMYTLNGKYPLLGVSEQKLKDGDRIVFHYSDDYTIENTGFNQPDTGDEGGEEEDLMVDAVKKMIDNIGNVAFDATSKAKIDAARKAYDKLSLEQKKKVENYALLQAAEKAYAELEAKDDQQRADEVIRLIEAMGADSDRIAEARAAYDALTDAQKKLVSNYALLTAAEYEQADATATGVDRSASNGAVDLIAALGTKITSASEADVAAARSAYDALSDTQKKLVTNYELLTAAEKAITRLSELADFERIFLAAGDALEANQETSKTDPMSDVWRVIGLARSKRDVEKVYYDDALAYIAENMDENQRLDANKATDNARMILMLGALGRDARDAQGYDLLAGLNEMAYVQKQGLGGLIWTLLAFKSNDYVPADGDADEQTLISAILEAQLLDGGWAFSGEEAEAEATALALGALAAYYDADADDQSELNVAVERGIDCLSMLQLADAGFGVYGADGEMISDSEAASWAIVALTALKIDPDTDERFIKSGVSALDALLAFAQPDGGFVRTADGEYDQTATDRAYCALVSYVRYLAGLNRFYDMTDNFEINLSEDSAQRQESKPLAPYIDISKIS